MNTMEFYMPALNARYASHAARETEKVADAERVRLAVLEANARYLAGLPVLQGERN